MAMSEYRGNPGETDHQKRERLLQNWAAISKALGLDKRDGNIADFDDELASMLALTASETRALFDRPA